MNKIKVKWNNVIVGHMDADTNEIKFLDNDEANKLLKNLETGHKIYISSRQTNTKEQFTYATTAELMIELGTPIDEALDIHNELNKLIKTKNTSENKLDDFHYHELLDRTNLIMMNINDYLVEHPVSDKHKDIKNKIEQARDLLHEVYQEICAKY